MEDKLKKIIHEKINESLSNIDEIQEITTLFEKLSLGKSSFLYGIVIGRLYNSFYYQCRRILKRKPTDQEFSEFLEILKQKEQEILEKLELQEN